MPSLKIPWVLSQILAGDKKWSKDKMKKIEGMAVVAVGDNFRTNKKLRRKAAENTLKVALAVAVHPEVQATLKWALTTGQVFGVTTVVTKVLSANHRRQKSHRAHSRPHASQTARHAHKELSAATAADLHDSFFKRTKRPMKGAVNNDVAMAA